MRNFFAGLHKKSDNSKHHCWRAGLTCIGLIVGVNTSLYAQDMEKYFDMSLEQLMQIPLTGSHITHVDNLGMVSVIDRKMIQHSGVTSLEMLLQRLPVSAGYAGNQSNAYWGALNGNGSAHVNLRGLGINRTLVLLNGRRLAYGGSGANAAVDLNSIPLAIIDRIEILTDGASAIYGADAVAGVVNIITRTNLEGGEAQVHYGETFQQDGEHRAANVSWGVNHERGSVLLSLSHSLHGDINMADRAPCALGEVGGELICVDSGNTIGGRALLENGQSVNFNQELGGNGDFYEPYSSAKHNFNGNPYLNAINPIERNSLSSFGTLILSDKLSAFTEILYSERHSDQLATPGTIGLNRPINIPAAHPTNPTGQNLLLQRRRLLEADTRNFYQDVESLVSVLGLKGQLASDWDWTVSLNYHRNTADDGSTNVVNLDRVEQTLDTSICSSEPNAAIPCADYLGYGDLTPAVIDYLMMTTRDEGGNEQKGLSASIAGEAFELPAGKIAIATGFEVRKDRGWRNSDPLTVLGIANTSLQQPITGDFTVREVFVEMNVPLLHQLPLIEDLSLSGAIRHSEYDLFGNVNNHKLGLNWELTSNFSLRTNYATAFRAPNVPELFAGAFNNNLVTSDPCSDWNDLPEGSVVAENCQNEGVPTDFQQLVPSILTTQGGNSKLKPERANTLTFGAIWTPTENIQLTLDYFDIDIEDAINSVDGSSKLAACYSSVGRSHPFCSSTHFTRNPISGQIDYLSIKQTNAASEHLSGIDFSAQYQFTLAGWDATLNTDISYLRDYDLLPYEGAETIHYAGKITGGRGSYAEWRSLGGISVARNAWSGAYTIQYIDAVEDFTAPEGAIGKQVPSVTYHNIQTQYALDESLEFTVGIDNLFDRDAPFVRSWLDVNTDTMTYDVQGRRWYAKATYRW